MAAVVVLVGCGSTTDVPERAASAAPIPVSAEALETCGVDTAEQERLLALTADEFDQDFDGGWRAIARGPGCELAAATVLEMYIEEHDVSPDVDVMHWHLGQLLGSAEEYEAAIPWLEAGGGGFAWHYYVNGTVAFMQRDRQALEKARDGLAGLEDPLNLEVLEGLIDCFDEPYSVAYACR